MKIRTLIVDDEPLAREGVAALCAADAEIEIIGQCADGAAAVQTIRREHPDLLFLDVQMPKRDGFEVLEGLPGSERPVVVFVTAHDQYAIHAFEACAVDYLLKPFSDKRFQQALTRAKNEVRQSRAQDVNRRLEELLARVAELRHGAPAATAAPTPEYAERIVVKAGGDLHFIKTGDVLWVEAQGDFVKVQTLEQPQLVRETLQSMEQKLDSSRFLRIHRSFLVNVQHIKRVAPALYGDHTVFMSDGSKLRLSRSYRGKLKAFIKEPPSA